MDTPKNIKSEERKGERGGERRRKDERAGEK